MAFRINFSVKRAKAASSDDTTIQPFIFLINEGKSQDFVSMVQKLKDLEKNKEKDDLIFLPRPFYVNANSQVAAMIQSDSFDAQVDEPVKTSFDRAGALTLISDQYVSTKGIAFVSYSVSDYNDVIFGKKSTMEAHILQFNSVK